MSKQVVYGHICKDCGQPFTIDKGEAEWYESKGFPLPKRCKECLKKRKEGKKGEKRGILDPRD